MTARNQPLSPLQNPNNIPNVSLAAWVNTGGKAGRSLAYLTGSHAAKRAAT
jgi:hypothetical protein